MRRGKRGGEWDYVTWGMEVGIRESGKKKKRKGKRKIKKEK